MTNYDSKQLCADLYKNFMNTLTVFYENISDCPAIYLELCVFNHEAQIQYNISGNDISISPKITVPEYFYELPETGYHGTFDSKNSDALYFYKHGNTAFYISFKFQCDTVPEILKTLTRVFIESTVKPLSKILDSSEVTYFSCDFWREFDEETIISKTIAVYLAYFYCLDNNFVNLLSTQKYEGEMLHGLIFASQRGTERAKNDLSIKLQKKVQLTENIRKTRKMLEISGSKLAMVVGRDTMILGYVNLIEKERKPYECRIEIIGHLNIKYCFNETIIKYADGRYRIENSKEQKLPSLPRTGLHNFSPEEVDKINQVMKIASEQKHGTLFIIGKPRHIIKETYRLCNLGRGTKTHPFSLWDDNKNSKENTSSKSKENLIRCITSIDGAVFMDTNCICHGIGLILDGPAIVSGNPARGARYNSAINYVEYQIQNKRNFIAAIISEDTSLEYYLPNKS